LSGIDSYTKLLLHLNGVDGTLKEYLDSGNTGHLFGRSSGSTLLSNAQKKLGASSLSLGGAYYISAPDHTDWDCAGDFTIEGFFFWEGKANDMFLMATCDDDATNAGWLLNWIQGTTRLQFQATSGGGAWDVVSVNSNAFDPTLNTWYHIAVVRSSGTITFYIDAVAAGGGSDSSSITGTGALHIGSDTDEVNMMFNGFIDEVRISGVARTITVPTSPYVSDANTRLLLHFESYDSSSTTAPKQPSMNNTAQLDTAQKKFGSASLLLDGDSDYISVPDSADWNFGSGDFTLDFWIRINALPANGWEDPAFMQYVDADNRWWWALRNNGGSYEYRLYVKAGGSVTHNRACTLNPQPALNTWYHIALARNGNTWYSFQGGTQIDTWSDSDSMPDLASSLFVGAHSDQGYTDGWLDEVRVSKGIARWTANFTPPTSEYTKATPMQAVII
jgi:hypothetical protein